MTQQEAYMELHERLRQINKDIEDAYAFATEHKLVMGEPRYNPGTFQVVDPATGAPEGEDAYDNSSDYYSAYGEAWISSSVCW